MLCRKQAFRYDGSMKSKFYALILLAVLVAGSISGCDRPQDQGHITKDHFKTGYVSWGIDEFELFGLTKEKLDEKFKDRMHFRSSDSAAVWNDGRAAHFRLAFGDDNKVATVQRIFIDGAGCEIKGPLLKSKKEALDFSVDGLSKLGHLDQGDQSKLETAQALLKESSK
jgi:hypothetical protein